MCEFLTGLESKGRPVRGWKALVAVASNEWRFCFFQLLQGRKGEGLWARCGGRTQVKADRRSQLMPRLANVHKSLREASQHLRY